MMGTRKRREPKAEELDGGRPRRELRDGARGNGGEGFVAELPPRARKELLEGPYLAQPIIEHYEGLIV
jgi:hypothetical protein